VEIVITADDAAAATIAAGIVERVLAEREAPVIGLATGSSPLPTYARLIDRHRAGAVSFARATAVVLDEYVGLAPDHPQSYRSVVRRELVDHVDLAPDRLFTPDVHTDDLAVAAARYDELLAELGGVDVQLLGIGADGHVGFNEPSSSLASRTRVKTLTGQTRADNARFFADPDDVPRHVVTQGLGTILDARHLVLVACGPAKAAPIAAAVEGPVSAMCPASVLQLHPHATVVVDEAAAGDLRLGDYYRETWEHKPPWQHP
jgi:glucosamine-6-phosphate deaminase